MSFRVALLPFVLLFVIASAGLADDASSSPGANLHERGEFLLRAGRIDEAAQAFLEAARAEPANQAYTDRALQLRRVQGLRRFVASNPPSDRWQSSVLSLHLFYLRNGLPDLALDLDLRAHEALDSAASAEWLAETYLALDRNADATTVLAPYSATSPRHAAYHAIALARLGRIDDARRLAAAAVVAEDASPVYLFDVARVHALLGESERALALLRASLEKTPEVALDEARRRARAHRDLRGLATLPAFAEVLRTESQVAQTCSGGSSCSSCPNRGRCGGGSR
ncbi:MAG: hypothetical protein ACYTG6_07745 [Planctomycetota bacterium]|jgi:tetratricopeptide (TPR) repeat protein